MTSEELEVLATSWIQLHKSDEKSIDYKLNFWAYSALDELVDNCPLQSLEVIIKILDLDDTDGILANVAAGPLEDLLGRHGNEVIDEVIRLAKSNRLFRRVLGAVWQSSIPAPIWVQIKKIASPTW